MLKPFFPQPDIERKGIVVDIPVSIVLEVLDLLGVQSEFRDQGVDDAEELRGRHLSPLTARPWIGIGGIDVRPIGDQPV